MPGLTWFKEAIQQVLPEVALSDGQFSALYSHFELLCRWNQKMDLTSVVTPEEIVNRHYCESLFFGAQIPEEREELSVVDFGSGAGFPGFPLAVLRPKWRIILLEANQRRGVFLKEASRSLLNVRVEVQRGDAFHERHDWVVARAVKVADVLRSIPTIAPRIGLLIGASSARELFKETCCRWKPPIKIPGSDARCCLLGDCST
ncbi:MAG: 16S rRNA (guanine(527)-N(7))-methyltransferase RsmG [Bryobacteraceae bacterium]